MSITPDKIQRRLNDLMLLVMEDFFRRIEVNPASFDDLTLRAVAQKLDRARGEEMDAIAALLGVRFDAVRESALREIGGNRKEDSDSG